MDILNNRNVMSQYEIERVIGSGNFGTVYLAKRNGAFFALKEINLNNLTSPEKQRAVNEVVLLSKLSHRYIIKYRDSSIDHICGKLFIITDYADCGDLANAIAKQKGYPFNQTTIILWFLQICLALQYIHSRNILHRDLKTQNIFLCKDKTIKVGDFGIARILGNSQDFANTGIGTPFYFSPEICLKKPYNTKSDIWALGCVLYEMTTLTHPFRADDLPQLMSVILEGKLSPFPSWSSKFTKPLVESLLCTDPDKRPSIDQVLAHPSLQQYLSYIEKPNKPVEETYRSRKESCKRNASTSSSHCSKVPKISPKAKENENKPYSVFTRVIPPAIVVTEYQTPKRIYDNEKNERFALARATSSAIVTHTKSKKQMENEQKLRSASIQGISSHNKAQNKLMENKPKPRSASTRSTPPVVLDYKTENKSKKYEFKRGLVASHSPSEYKDSNKVLNSKPFIEGKKNINETYTVTREKNCGTNPSEIQSKSIPNEIDCGYSSEEINCSADSTDNSICVHSISNTENDFSILKGKEYDEKSVDQSLCLHSQCQQCMIEMMWKNRIRGCVSPKENKSDYLKLKDKLLLVFEPDLFKKVYESLLIEWEGNGKSQSHSAIRSYVKNLNYEQTQHLPLMIQLVQLDIIKEGTYLQSDELVML